MGGKPAQSRAVLLPELPVMRARLGDRHPLVLRALYALGLAHLQLSGYAPAAEVLSAVWEAQQELIGPRHPDTLPSQLQYGIALKLADRRHAQRSAELISAVYAQLPPEIGRWNDLRGQAWLARGLRWTPAPVVTVLQELGRRLERFDRR